MATYYGAFRTNIFRVTDEKRYNELFNGLVGDDIEDFTEEVDGEIYHGFGGYDNFDYLNPVTKESDFDGFLDELQKILPEEEIFVFFESGHEKLGYVGGCSIVVTKDEIKSTHLRSWADEIAKEKFGQDYRIAMSPPESKDLER